MKPSPAFKNLPVTRSPSPTGPRPIARRLSRKRRRKIPRSISDAGIDLPPLGGEVGGQGYAGGGGRSGARRVGAPKGHLGAFHSHEMFI